MTRAPRIAIFVAAFAFAEALLIMFVDQPLSEALRGVEATHPAVIDFFRSITDFGKSRWYLWPSGVGIFVCALLLRIPAFSPPARRRIADVGHDLVFFFASIALSGIVTDIVKPILGRARPVEWLRESAYGFHPFTFSATWNSMPSGHATTAAALAAVLIILFPRMRIVWVLIGIALAASRVMVNAHFLSDVLAGAATGILTTLFLARYRTAQGMFPWMKGIFPIDKNQPVVLEKHL